MKSFKKFFSVLFVCVLLSLTVCSDYISCYNVKASGVISDISNDLLYYFLSITGSISKKDANNGLESSISSVSSAVRSALLEEIDDQITNNGIYEDNGQIIFTSQAMEDLYYILNGNSSVNVRAISDFSKFNIYGDPSFANYVNNTYLQDVSNRINSLSTPFIINVHNSKQINYNSYGEYSYTQYDTNCYIFYNVSDVAYYSVDSNNSSIRGFNSSGTDIGLLDYYRYTCSYRTNNQTFSNSTSTLYQYGIYSIRTSYISWNSIYNIFPSGIYYHYTTSNGRYVNDEYDNFYCNNSILLAKSSTYGNGALNQNSGTFYFNNYNNIAVEKNIITNNNWSSIYNSYVTNVSNTYNTEVTNNNGSDLTAKQVRQIMNTYLQPIYNAIDEGLTDIAEKVDYINEWLSKIYSNGSLIITRLDSIIQIIQQNTGGSGSTSGTACAWSEQEVDIVLDKLSRIYTEQVDNDLDVIAALEYIKTKISSLDTTLTTASSNISTISSNTSSIVTSLDTELSRLATVLTKMDTIISKMGQNRITRPTVDPNIIDDLEDLLPESVLDDIFSPFAALGSIIETVVPFCYIGVAVAIMSNLSAEAEAPYWEIPFKYDSDALALHIDEKIVIDLSPFEDLSTILRLLFIIAFTISLMFFSLPLVNYMTGIFSGK